MEERVVIKTQFCDGFIGAEFFYYKDVKSGVNGLWGTAVPKP